MSGMKLVKKSVYINETSFSPELEVTIRIPMEKMQDNKAIDAKFHEKLGMELASLISK